MTFKSIAHRLNRRDLPLFAKFSTTIKISIVILVAFAAIVTTKNILAQEEPPANKVKEMQENMLKGNNQESWLDNAMGSNLMSLQVMTAGTIPEAILDGGADLNQVYIPGGLIGITNQIIASTFTPSASGIEYIAQLKNEFLGKPAYAANETGFNSLKPIMGLWKTFRNVVYVFISLYFMILGIMIMLRIKISPQAVITIQSSLPKVITTLVLVTFSYAIAGFCIDIMNLFQALCISILFTGAGKTIGSGDGLFPVSWKQWTLTNFWQLLKSAWGDNYFKYNNINNPNFWMIKDLIQRLAPNSVITLLGAVVGGAIGASMTIGPAMVAGVLGGAALGGVLFGFIITVIIIIYMIKLCFGLVKTYINVLIQIVFSPFLIFIGIFPTSKKGFSDWLTNLIANLAVFPATLLFLLIANLLVDTFGGQGFAGGAGIDLWAPTLVKGPFAWFLPTIVGISAIAMISKIPQLVPEAVFGLKPSPFGKAIGEGFAALPGAGTVKNVRAGVAKRQQDFFGGEGVDAARQLSRRGLNKAAMSRPGFAAWQAADNIKEGVNNRRQTIKKEKTSRYNAKNSPGRDASVPG